MAKVLLKNMHYVKSAIVIEKITRNSKHEQNNYLCIRDLSVKTANSKIRICGSTIELSDFRSKCYQFR